MRQIIKIDEELCEGCGICVDTCVEGAIAMVDGKAKMVRDDYCDGLGNCLPNCPAGAISFTLQESSPAKNTLFPSKKEEARPSACPGSSSVELKKDPVPLRQTSASALKQWPVQIKLAPIKAPFFQGAKLLIAADCTAYSYDNFHNDFMEGWVTLIGCPKLDEGDYTEKLTAIIRENDIKEVHLVRMEVPCCGGLERVLYKSMQDSKKNIPWHITTLTTSGKVKK
ncbi:MAG: 4Fe-4S binding protein [Tissierellia bacterium]|nr:4Fe-4S binding protein [Tissierellia bacterium]